MFADAWNKKASEACCAADKRGLLADKNLEDFIEDVGSEYREVLWAYKLMSVHGLEEDKHLRGRTNLLVELADVVITIMSFSNYLGWDLAGTILDKIEFNKTRED